MDYLIELGGIALGSRLKRLSERIGQEVATIYKNEKVSFEPRWFPVFRYLAGNGSTSIMDIAAAISVTHPAVNQVANEMMKAGLLVQDADANDKRRRLLSLSKSGKKLYAELEPILRIILLSVNEAIEESGHDLLGAIKAMENTLDKKELSARFVETEKRLQNAKVAIVEFEPLLRDSFRLLNEAWISKYFVLEEADVEILNQPEKIIEAGGTIFFAQVAGRTVGTCALIKTDHETYEIAKMAVNDSYQGMGIGQFLLDACISRAREKHAKQVTLETNKKLESAVRLYKKAGFTQVTASTHPSKYSRVDLDMKLEL